MAPSQGRKKQIGFLGALVAIISVTWYALRPRKRGE
jgi:cbb3-type cytochrome oxidase subunit 3